MTSNFTNKVYSDMLIKAVTYSNCTYVMMYIILTV